MNDQSNQTPPADVSRPQGVLHRYAIAGAVLLVGALSLYGVTALDGDAGPERGDLPEGTDPTATLATLPGGDPSHSGAPPALDSVGMRQNRTAAGDPSSAGAFVELSDLSKEALKDVREREERLEQAAQLADIPDERSPADAELIEELERHLEEESFDDAQLEMELISAERSLQMMRAFKEATQDR